MEAVNLTDPAVIENLSDGHHTFAELYHHRNLLWLNMLKTTENAWVSQFHDDGTSYDGWFISGIHLPTGDITYHMPSKYWNLIIDTFDNVELLDKAPKWDGHTSNEVLIRLLDYIFEA